MLSKIQNEQGLSWETAVFQWGFITRMLLKMLQAKQNHTDVNIMGVTMERVTSGALPPVI